MVNFEPKPTYNVEDLRQIVALLRAPGGCPWDGAQTHESLRRNFIEEAYEVAEAIDEASPAHLKEELGDVLLQVLFHASIEEDAGRFNLDEVADGICKKLIFRHPHVFGQGGEAPPTAGRPSSARRRARPPRRKPSRPWPKACPACGGQRRSRPRPPGRALSGPTPRPPWTSWPRSWPSSSRPWRRTATSRKNWGDLLFAAVKVARFFHIDAEEALAGTCEKFIRRFSGWRRRSQPKAGPCTTWTWPS